MSLFCVVFVGAGNSLRDPQSSHFQSFETRLLSCRNCFMMARMVLPNEQGSEKMARRAQSRSQESWSAISEPRKNDFFHLEVSLGAVGRWRPMWRGPWTGEFTHGASTFQHVLCSEIRILVSDGFVGIDRNPLPLFLFSVRFLLMMVDTMKTSPVTLVIAISGLCECVGVIRRGGFGFLLMWTYLSQGGRSFSIRCQEIVMISYRLQQIVIVDLCECAAFTPDGSFVLQHQKTTFGCSAIQAWHAKLRTTSKYIFRPEAGEGVVDRTSQSSDARPRLSDPSERPQQTQNIVWDIAN